MKAKVYYWIAIIVLLLSNAVFVVIAQIQGGHAREAVQILEMETNAAMEQLAEAEQQVKLAEEQSQKAQKALEECEGSK